MTSHRIEILVLDNPSTASTIRSAVTFYFTIRSSRCYLQYYISATSVQQIVKKRSSSQHPSCCCQVPWTAAHSWHDGAPLEPWVRQLVKPLTSEEIRSPARSLKNGRANGPDGIPSELFEYSTRSVHRRFADIINRSFKTTLTITLILNDENPYPYFFSNKNMYQRCNAEPL